MTIETLIPYGNIGGNQNNLREVVQVRFNEGIDHRGEGVWYTGAVVCKTETKEWLEFPDGETEGLSFRVTVRGDIVLTSYAARAEWDEIQNP